MTLLSNGWSKGRERMCRIVQQRASAFEWLHNHVATRKERVNTWLGIISSFGAFITGTGSLFSSVSESSKIVSIVLNSLVVVFSAVGMVKKRLGYGEIVGKHRVMIGKYQLLADDILKELVTPSERRHEFDKFYIKVCETETSIRHERGSANIQPDAYEVYKEYFGDKALDPGTLFGSIQFQQSNSSSASVHGRAQANLQANVPEIELAPVTED